MSAAGQYEVICRIHDVWEAQLGGLLNAVYPDGIQERDRRDAAIMVVRMAAQIEEPLQLVICGNEDRGDDLQLYVPAGFLPKGKAAKAAKEYAKTHFAAGQESFWMPVYNHASETVGKSEGNPLEALLAGVTSGHYWATPLYFLDVPEDTPKETALERQAALGTKVGEEVIVWFTDGHIIRPSQPERPAKKGAARQFDEREAAIERVVDHFKPEP